MPADKAFFNQQVSRLGMLNKHCIGMLKGRFQCLRELRVVIRGKQDVGRIRRWFNACCVLHNILLETGFYDAEWDNVLKAAEDGSKILVYETCMPLYQMEPQLLQRMFGNCVGVELKNVSSLNFSKTLLC
jgi:hypothetical protein